MVTVSAEICTARFSIGHDIPSGFFETTVEAGCATGRVSTGEDFLSLANSSDHLLLADGSSGLLLTTSIVLAFSVALTSNAATFTGQANDATVFVASSNPNSQVATATASALAPKIVVSPNAGAGSGTATAHTPTISAVSLTVVSAGVATASGQAFTTTSTVIVNPDEANAVADAEDGDALTVAEGVAPGGVALSTASALTPKIAVSPSVDVATGTWAAISAEVLGQRFPDPAPYAVTYHLDALVLVELDATDTQRLDGTTSHAPDATSTERVAAHHTYRIKR